MWSDAYLVGLAPGFISRYVTVLSSVLQSSAESTCLWYWSGEPGPWFNIKMPFYQYRKSHSGDRTVVRSSYLHNGISYTGKMASSYWTSPLPECLYRKWEHIALRCRTLKQVVCIIRITWYMECKSAVTTAAWAIIQVRVIPLWFNYFNSYLCCWLSKNCFNGSFHCYMYIHTFRADNIPEVKWMIQRKKDVLRFVF